MARKKVKLTQAEIDKTSQLAMDELLELSNIKFNDQMDDDCNKQTKSKKGSQSKKTDKKENVEIKNEFQPELEEDENFDPTNLISIINHAKKMGAKVNKNKWVNSEKDREEDIISKAKQEGKSQYDSDVLRQLILERQMKKNQAKGLSSIINKVKK